MLEEQVQAFASAFEKELKDSFSELAEGVQFFLLIRNSQKEYPWIVGPKDYSWSAFSGTKENEAWLEYFQTIINETDEDSDKEISEVLRRSAEKEKIIYYFCEKGKDHSWIKEKSFGGKKDVLWLVRGKVRGEAVSAILRDIMEKTREELSDLIFLSYYRQIPYIEERLAIRKVSVKNQGELTENLSLLFLQGNMKRENYFPEFI